MTEYIDFNKLVYHLVKGTGHDSSLISEPIKAEVLWARNYKIIDTPEGKQDKLEGNEVYQVTFNEDDLAISYYYPCDHPDGQKAHKARWQRLDIRRSTRGGLEKAIRLEEVEHKTKLSVENKEHQPPYEEIPINSFSLSQMYRQIKDFLQY